VLSSVVIVESGIIDTSVIVAIIGGVGAFLGILLDRHRQALERKREMAATALSDALQWLEVAYRIRRRTSDAPAELARLAEHLHNLQERHTFHASWLEVDLPQAHPAYEALLTRVRSVAAEAIKAAWNASPIASASDMNLGRLLDDDATAAAATYVAAVRRELRLIPIGRLRR
jgi:hypothetical protein